MRAAPLVAIALTWSPAALAGPVLDAATTARPLGRAGAALVSDDGPGALLAGPASLARAPARRGELGLVVHDADASFRADGDPDRPTIVDRGRARVAPSALVAAPLGPLVLAMAYLEQADHAAETPAPASGQPAADVARLFPHRYAGTAAALSIRTVAVAGALRLGDALAIGLAVHGSTIELGERRTVWAGFAGRDQPGDPARDLELEVRGRDGFVPGAALGVLVAPAALPVELAASARVRARGGLHGDAGLVARHGAVAPTPVGPGTAGLTLPRALDLGLGLRYLGDRFGIELAGEVGVVEADRPRWRLDAVEVVDESGARADVVGGEALLARGTRWAGRGCVEVAAVEGLLWLTAGYAYVAAGQPAGRASAASVDLATHTIALGAEASWDGIGLTLGWGRSLARARRGGGERDALAPFGPGPTAATGSFDASGDQVGLAVRVDWP